MPHTHYSWLEMHIIISESNILNYLHLFTHDIVLHCIDFQPTIVQNLPDPLESWSSLCYCDHTSHSDPFVYLIVYTTDSRTLNTMLQRAFSLLLYIEWSSWIEHRRHRGGQQWWRHIVLHIPKWAMFYKGRHYMIRTGFFKFWVRFYILLS